MSNARNLANLLSPGATTLGSSAIADNAITGAKVVAGALSAADIEDSSITAAKLATDSVTTAKIEASAVTTAKIADAAVTSAKALNLGRRNKIINGQYAVASRATSFTSTGSANNDAVYTLDRWKLLSDGNDIVDVSQETSTVPTNKLFALKLDVETEDKKFGIAQVVENNACTGLIGNSVTLSFQAKVSDTSKLDNIKCAIISWSSTADSPTADMISAWGDEGTDPTLASNFTYENTPANLNVTTSYAKYSVTASVDTSSAANVIAFIWSDVTDTTAGHHLFITDVQLEEGSSATDYEQRAFHEEERDCQRYYYEIHSATNYSKFGVGRAWSTDDTAAALFLPVAMRTTPSMATSTIGTNFGVAGVGSGISAITLAERDVNNQLFTINVAYGTTSFTTGNIYQIESNGNTTGFISFDAEI